jgi:hypothetical protein
MTEKTSRERPLPKQGGFETRPGATGGNYGMLNTNS